MSANYTDEELGAIFNLYPTAVKIDRNGVPYDSNGNVITINENDVSLSVFRSNELQRLKNELIKNLGAGFRSSALGTEYIYKSSVEDQLNIMGAVMDGVDAQFKCGELINGEIRYQYRLHTIDQLRQVFNDGAEYKKILLLKYDEQKNKILLGNRIE